MMLRVNHLLKMSATGCRYDVPVFGCLSPEEPLGRLEITSHSILRHIFKVFFVHEFS